MLLRQSSRMTVYGAGLLIAGLWLGVSATAQELEIAISPTPVGSGARAAGMADAFVAIADDATAASWNPAGLVQLEKPEFSIVGSYNGVFESFEADYHDEVESDHQAHNFDLNYASFVYPLPFLVFGRNASLALNYQRKYDFSRDFTLDYTLASATSRGRLLTRLLTMEFEQDGGLSTITPAFALEITHRFSIGASLNLWRSSFLSENSWNQTIRLDEIDMLWPMLSVLNRETKEKYRDFSGDNLTLGVLWNFADKWNFGARYDTAFTGEADYRRIETRTTSVFPLAGFRGSLTGAARDVREKRHVRFPDSLALGLAYRANDRLTVSADVTRTDWNDFYVKDGNGQRYSLVDFGNRNTRWTRTHFDPTYTARLGFEYVFVPEQPDEELNRLWTLRGGVFYDEEPATGKSEGFKGWVRDAGSGDPDGFYGVAAGLGLLAHHRVNIDLAYQLRYAENVNRDFIRGVRGFREDVAQHRVLLSTVVYF